MAIPTIPTPILFLTAETEFAIQGKRKIPAPLIAKMELLQTTIRAVQTPIVNINKNARAGNA